MFPSSSQRSWTSFLTSAVVHAALLLAVVQLTRQRVEVPAEQRAEEADPGRQVQMVYLEAPPPPKVQPPEPPRPKPPPPPAPAPAPAAQPPQPVAPAPEKEQRTPEPEANAPPEATRSKGEDRTTDAPEGGAKSEATESGPSASENLAALMESEARRIFGRPRPGPRPGAGPRAVRPMEALLPDDPQRCIPKPQLPADSAGAPQYGIVVGKIFRRDDGRPLAGAHLQMLGTPYVTFTDASGEYRFRFNLALVDNCRTQYVRVTADGYESRLLVLVVGENVQSEDVLLKRR